MARLLLNLSLSSRKWRLTKLALLCAVCVYYKSNTLSFGGGDSPGAAVQANLETFNFLIPRLPMHPTILPDHIPLQMLAAYSRQL